MSADLEHVIEVHWWDNHMNLCMVAEWMLEHQCDVGEIVYMLEKPWKYEEEYLAAKRSNQNQNQGE